MDYSRPSSVVLRELLLSALANQCNAGIFCRHLWDEDLETWDMIEKIDDHTDVFFYTTKSMILQPKRRHVVLR